MKKIELIVLIVSSNLNLFTQIEKGRIIITLDGNYIKTTTENGVTLNQNVSQIENLNIGTSVGYFMTDRLVVGVGLDYYWDKESRVYQLKIYRFFQSEVMNIKSNAFLPDLYIGYYFPIISKLYINTNMKFSYSKFKTDYNSSLVEITYNQSENLNLDTIPNSLEYFGGSKNSAKTDLFNAEIFPELTYFVSSKVGLCLGLGGIEYSIIDWKTDNSSWTINFNPINWRLGIKFKI
jgi:hypothetical protein